MNEIDNIVLHKEIDLIQACITRMAHNSFLIKGWTLSIVAIVLSLATNKNSLFFELVLLVPVVGFWYLDAFFLRTEKMYRMMYEWVLKNRFKGNTDMLYDLNPTRFSSDAMSLGRVMRSVTLRWFYGIPLSVIIILILTNLPFIKKLYHCILECM